MSITEENVRFVFGLKVREYRTALGLKPAQLAKKTGLSPSYLNEIEKGKKYPKADKISALAEGLNTTYDELVSLQLNQRLAPLSNLIQSNILSDLPLDIYGLDPSRVLELLADAPAKLNAFISTLAEMARNYNMKVETFYFSALRAYQEMHQNYFEDLEQAAEAFLKSEAKAGQTRLNDTRLAAILTQQYNYTIHEQMPDNPHLATLRSLLKPGKKPVLYLNNGLTPKQRAFVLGKELAYQVLGLKERPYTSSYVAIKSFDELLNYFKASYFSSAVLIPKQAFVQDMKALFNQRSLLPMALLRLFERYQATPEMLLQRLTSLLPKHFGIKELFFLRFTNKPGSDYFRLSKELHIGSLHNPHASILDEHYCRRWISVNILKDLTRVQRAGRYKRPIAGMQRSSYIDSNKEYLIFALARPMMPTPELNTSISIGLLMTPSLKRTVKFWNDESIIRKDVNEACEYCPLTDCKDRAAEPKLLQHQQKTEAIKAAVDAVMNEE